MKMVRVVMAAFAALFLSSQVMASSHSDKEGRVKKDDSPVVYEYVL